MVRRVLLTAFLCLLTRTCVSAQAQEAVPTPAPDAVAERDPEDALLSPSSYTNAFFGLQFDLPPEAKLKPIAMPASADRRIQLLELLGSAPAYASVSLNAYEYKNKNYTDAKGILRHQLDQELFVGVEELHGLSKISIGGIPFYYFETRRGVEQHVEVAGQVNGYVLYAAFRANDAKMVKDLAAAFYRAQFFPPKEASQRAGAGAVAYQGPAISSQRLREVKAAAPAERMDPGQIEGNVYRNAQIGMRYEFPKGWSLHLEGAIEPAVVRYHEKVTGEPVMGPRERAVVKACRRTLLSVWRTTPDADGQVPYDEFGEVTLYAMPLSCFPNIHFPDDPKDAPAIRRFIVGLSLTEPLQRDMSDARSYEAGGRSFVLTRGTIAYKEAGDELSRRVSVATALTQQRGYLLIWLFAAPHDTELRELLNAKMGFDAEPANRESSVSRSAGGSGASDGGQSVADTSARTNAATVKTEQGTAAPSVTTSSTTANPPAPSTAQAAGAQAYAPPSLLREGEDMQGQQMQGKPIPGKKPN